VHKIGEREMVEQLVAPENAGVLRRLMAMVYDSFLLVALFFIVTIPFVLQVGEQTLTQDPLVHALYQLVLVLSAFLFFGWFWTHGGQTLGMRAWRLRTLKSDGSPMSWPASMARFAAALLSIACFGLGIVWIVIDPERLAWHDRLSRTRVVVEPKKVKSKLTN
jgi:uncharacterized RDD family membrane protein YckC